jgi:hypothetical protein
MTERILTREEIIQKFTPQRVIREPRPDGVQRRAIPVEFVEFRDKRGRLRLAIPAVHYDGPPVDADSDVTGSTIEPLMRTADVWIASVPAPTDKRLPPFGNENAWAEFEAAQSMARIELGREPSHEEALAVLKRYKPNA